MIGKAYRWSARGAQTAVERAGGGTRFEVRRAFDMMHCPACKKPAAQIGLKRYPGGIHLVTPQWKCDTEGCDFRLDGPRAWTPDSRG